LSTAALASAASVCECRNYCVAEAYCRRLSAVEAMYENLRDALDGLRERISLPEATERLVQTELTDRLEQFRAELEEKLKHLTPSNFRTDEQNRDIAAPLDAAKQECAADLAVDNLSEKITSVYLILRTEVMQEVGQLRSFVESETRSLRGQLEVESAKVQRNVISLEATISQCIGEVMQDFAKLEETGITHEREVSELRSQLEVVVCTCDERLSKEESRQAEESAAFMSTLREQVSARYSEEKGLSDRVENLEKALLQAKTMSSNMLDAKGSLRAELRQVMDAFREDLDCLNRAMDANSRRNEKEFGDLAESKDPEGCSRPHDVAGVHRRLLDPEAAYTAESKRLRQFEQHRSNVEQGLSEEMLATLNSQVALVTQRADLSQKQYTVVQERISNLTDFVVNLCTAKERIAGGVGKSSDPASAPAVAVKQQHQQRQQQQEQRQTSRLETESMRSGLKSNSVPPVGMTTVSSLPSFVNQPRSAQSLERQVPQERRTGKAGEMQDEVSDEIRAEQARQVMLAEEWVAATEAAFSADLNSVRDTVACTLMSRTSALESMMTQHMGSSKNNVARGQLRASSCPSQSVQLRHSSRTT